MTLLMEEGKRTLVRSKYGQSEEQGVVSKKVKLSDVGDVERQRGTGRPCGVGWM